jgi:hypothetical protein
VNLTIRTSGDGSRGTVGIVEKRFHVGSAGIAQLGSEQLTCNLRAVFRGRLVWQRQSPAKSFFAGSFLRSRVAAG